MYRSDEFRHPSHKQPTHKHAMAPRAAKALDPVASALQMLDQPKRRDALLKALEERIRGDIEERRFFAAASGRVYGLSGQDALVQAVRNYLKSLSDTDAAAGRTGMLAFLAETVASLSGSPRLEDKWAAWAATPGHALASRS